MTDQSPDDWFNPDATTFGDRVAGAREKAGMSQSQLAKRLGIKLKTLKAWEDDQSEPRANKASMMAGLLNVSHNLFRVLRCQGAFVQPRAGTARHDAVNWGYARAADRLGVLEKTLRARLTQQARS